MTSGDVDGFEQELLDQSWLAPAASGLVSSMVLRESPATLELTRSLVRHQRTAGPASSRNRNPR